MGFMFPDTAGMELWEGLGSHLPVSLKKQAGEKPFQIHPFSLLNGVFIPEKMKQLQHDSSMAFQDPAQTSESWNLVMLQGTL